MASALAIDSEFRTHQSLRFALSGVCDQVVTCGTAAEGLRAFAESRPDVVLLDLRLPDAAGLELFQQLQALDPKVPVVLMNGAGSADVAIQATRLGAFDYLTKPFDPDHLGAVVGRALEVVRLMRGPAVVVGSPNPDRADVLLGQSPAMQEVYKAIGQVAASNVTVLILGESGTGKEVVARAVYDNSRRSERPFLALNCAAIPETLLESELFGHEKGSFTGADRRRAGKFELCHGGTLFLDEIGDMTLPTQAKLLRVLQEQSFERVGGSELVRTDVRLIAATNRDLPRMVAEGRFREDLYYRLNVFSITVPPLRDRAQDIPALAAHFVRESALELGKVIQGFAPEALERLVSYPWPGNVRELQSCVTQAIVRATGPVLVPGHLPGVLSGAAGRGAARQADGAPALGPIAPFVLRRIRDGADNLFDEVMCVVEKQLLTEVLEQVHGNSSQACRILGISRPTLRAKLAAHGLSVQRSAHLDASET